MWYGSHERGHFDPPCWQYYIAILIRVWFLALIVVLWVHSFSKWEWEFGRTIKVNFEFWGHNWEEKRHLKEIRLKKVKPESSENATNNLICLLHYAIVLLQIVPQRKIFFTPIRKSVSWAATLQLRSWMGAFAFRLLWSFDYFILVAAHVHFELLALKAPDSEPAQDEEH